MAFFASKQFTSLFGRRFGLQCLSTAENGGRLKADFLVGAEAVREGVTTSETTGTNLLPYGISSVNGTSAGSSSVYVLDPPVPGVRKVITFGSTSISLYVKTKNSETIVTTMGTSFTTIKSTGNAGGAIELMGYTTAVWLGLAGLTSGTSSQGAGVVLTTST